MSFWRIATGSPAGIFALVVAGTAAAALPLSSPTSNGGAMFQRVQAGGGPDGCSAANGRWYPNGARVPSNAINGVNNLSAVTQWYVCRRGEWINERTGQKL